MTKIYTLLIFVVTSLATAKPLHIEITGGDNTGVPIVVLPFEHEANEAKFATDKIASIIRSDLQNSGQFRVIDVDVAGQELSQLKKLGIEKVVVGKIAKNPAQNYNISFQLVDLYKGGEQTPLLNMIFADKQERQFRGIAHRISDLVFKSTTGVLGFFSTRIAYITVERQFEETTQTLYVADADGYNPQQLVVSKFPLMSPRWSPDAKSLAFVSFEENRSSIKIVRPAIGEITNLVATKGINGSPAWSPDGRQLAVVLSKDGSPKIYTMSLTDRKLRKVTFGNSIDTEPFWDPSGDSLVFTSNRGGKPQIYRVTLATGKVQRLTFIGDYNASPNLTPDGKQLVMLHRSEDGYFNIAVQELRTGRLKRLTKAGLDESPSLAPNGMMVLYGTSTGDSAELAAVTLDGRFRMRLPVCDGNVKEPAWSPFLS